VEYSVDSILSPNIKICQPIAGFRFSIDSILLAKFVKNKEFESILDIGTGSGVLSVLLHNLGKCNKADAVEADESLYNCLLKTIDLNGLTGKISPFRLSISEFRPNCTYDMIICNPPYRGLSSGRISRNNTINRAKTDVSLSLQHIMEFSKSYLKNAGYLYLSYRSDRLVEMVGIARKYCIEPKRIRFFYPDETKSSNIVLIECRKMGGKGVKIEPPIFQYKDGRLTQGFKNIVENKLSFV